MDKFKEKTFNDYDSWDIRCPYVARKRKVRRKLIDLFKRKARRKLKRELNKEVRDEKKNFGIL